MINPLKAATGGYLKRTTKAVLIIAVAGYLNFGGTPIPTDTIVGGGGSQTQVYRDYEKEHIDSIIKDDDDIIQVLKIFLQCRSKRV